MKHTVHEELLSKDSFEECSNVFYTSLLPERGIKENGFQ